MTTTSVNVPKMEKATFLHVYNGYPAQPGARKNIELQNNHNHLQSYPIDLFCIHKSQIR